MAIPIMPCEELSLRAAQKTIKPPKTTQKERKPMIQIVVENLNYEVFENIRDTLWTNPLTKHGIVSADYSKKLQKGQFWLLGQNTAKPAQSIINGLTVPVEELPAEEPKAPESPPLPPAPPVAPPPTPTPPEETKPKPPEEPLSET